MRLVSAICLALVAVTLVAFWSVGQSDFVNYDDPLIVVENDPVRAGITPESVRWAFTSSQPSGNWQPVTWLSHMLDCQLFGLDPGRHHAVNLGFHVANTLLLFLLLRQMTGAIWRSALVAALFALHPMHVESVAWVAERKDVLSGFFAMLTLLMYARYVQQSKVQGPRSKVFRGLALVCFALGLMSKSMLVTLPVILLLLDFWPLGRFGSSASGGPTGEPASPVPAGSLGRLALEKWPFFLMAASSGVMTFVAQRQAGAVGSFEYLPMKARIANALVAYWTYLRKAFWPENLAVFYPYQPIPSWQAVGAGLLLVGLSAFVVGKRRSHPYLLVGWLWFLVMLLPVIGLVQVGMQSTADRYTYLPYVGVFLLVAWAIGAAIPDTRAWRTGAALGAAAVLAAALVVTVAQVKYWRNSITLFTHASEVVPESALAHNNLGSALFDVGKTDEAVQHFRTALAISPRFSPAHSNLGSFLLIQGKNDEAEPHLRYALKVQETDAAHHNLGTILFRRQQYAEAEAHFRAALKIRPAHIDARLSLGSVLAMQGKNEEAEAEFMEGLRRDPDNPSLHRNLGNVLLARGKPAEAQAEFVRSWQLKVRRDPDNPTLHGELASLLASAGRDADAASEYSAAIRLNSKDPGLREAFAALLLKQGQTDKAHAQLREALELRPTPPGPEAMRPATEAE